MLSTQRGIGGGAAQRVKALCCAKPQTQVGVGHAPWGYASGDFGRTRLFGFCSVQALGSRHSSLSDDGCWGSFGLGGMLTERRPPAFQNLRVEQFDAAEELHDGAVGELFALFEIAEKLMNLLVLLCCVKVHSH